MVENFGVKINKQCWLSGVAKLSIEYFLDFQGDTLVSLTSYFIYI